MKVTLSQDIDSGSKAPLAPAAAISTARAAKKREKIVEAALRHFAERGYEGTRVEEIARELGIAKGSIFQYFGSKDRLLLEAYKTAVRSFPSYLAAPAEVQKKGFFSTIRYWLDRTEHMIGEDWVPYRVALLGNYATSLELKREITR